MTVSASPDSTAYMSIVKWDPTIVIWFFIFILNFFWIFFYKTKTIKKKTFANGQYTKNEATVQCNIIYYDYYYDYYE